MNSRQKHIPIFSCENLCFAYQKDHPVLKNVSFKVSPGERIVLLSENGGGKSTLFKLMAGILKPSSGSLLLNGSKYEQSAAFKRSLHTEIGLVFQDPEEQIFAGSVEQEVSFGAVNLDLPEEEVRRRTDKALRLTRTEHLRTRPIHHLSFGEKKRISIADLLVMDSRLLLLDEASAWLDPVNTQNITSVLEDLNREGCALICATHDVDWAYAFADRFLILHNGVICYDGSPEGAFANDSLLSNMGMRRPTLLTAAELLIHTGTVDRPETLHPHTRDLLSFADWVSGTAQNYVEVEGKVLRKGYTSGSCATAAALAALYRLAGLDPSSEVPIILPSGDKLSIPVKDSGRQSEESAYAVVTKDSGDDPDVTDAKDFCVFLTLSENTDDLQQSEEYGPLHFAGREGALRLFGGRGVGRVTKTGLKVAPGEAAINPVPRAMIFDNLKRALDAGILTIPENCVLNIIISVPEGEKLAKLTFNPRLGIEGGLSIIGTTGIIEPMSESRLKDSLLQELNVALAQNSDELALCFGNQGESALAKYLPAYQGPVIQCSNFIGFLLHRAVEKGYRRIIIGGALGKMIKLAGGIFQTHSHVADARAEIMCAYAALAGFPQNEMAELFACTTTDSALKLLKKEGLDEVVLDFICSRIREKLNLELHTDLSCVILLTDGSGRLLKISQDESSHLSKPPLNEA